MCVCLCVVPQDTSRRAAEARGAQTAAAAAGEAAQSQAALSRREVATMKAKALAVVRLCKRHEGTLDTVTSLYAHCLSSDVYVVCGNVVSPTPTFTPIVTAH